MNGWYPRINLKGQVISGFGSIYLDGMPTPLKGLKPKWFSNTRILFLDEKDRLLSSDLVSFVPIIVDSGPIVGFAAGFSEHAILDWPEQIELEIDRSDGKRAYIKEHNKDNKNRSVFYNDTAIVQNQFVLNVRVNEGFLTWTWFIGNDRKSYGLLNGMISDLTVCREDLELSTVPFKVGNEFWLLTQTNWDLRIHPAFSNKGYLIQTGENNNLNPDAISIEGIIKIAYQNEHGVLTVTEINPSAPRLDVGIRANKDNPIPIPIPEPVPVPVPNPQTKMKLPFAVYETFTQVVKKFPHSGNDEDRRSAMEKAVATIRAIHGPKWVWKTEHSNLSSPAKDALAYIPDEQPVHGAHQDMFIWDMINGSTRLPNPIHDSEPLRKAYTLIVEPYNYLSDEGETPTPPPVPPSNLELKKLELRIDDLLKQVSELRQEVANNRIHINNVYKDIEALLSNLPELPSDFARKGDAVEGYISVFGQKINLKDGRIRK